MIERADGARASLYTILGEFVLPASDRGAWTSTLVAACRALGIAEKNARQALARLGERGRIEPQRHGRRVRWHLTPIGERLLREGAARIYGFGAHSTNWDGEWLVAHCPVPESRRAVRVKLRTQLAFHGFGELSASLMVSPHVEREAALRSIVAELGIGDAVVLRSRTSGGIEDAELAARAWDLDSLSAEYDDFVTAHGGNRLAGEEVAFVATVRLVHAWRHFPSIDPELPLQLLPPNWSGLAAVNLFRNQRARLASAAVGWWADVDSRPASG